MWNEALTFRGPIPHHTRLFLTWALWVWTSLSLSMNEKLVLEKSSMQFWSCDFVRCSLFAASRTSIRRNNVRPGKKTQLSCQWPKLFVDVMLYISFGTKLVHLLLYFGYVWCSWWIFWGKKCWQYRLGGTHNCLSQNWIKCFYHKTISFIYSQGQSSAGRSGSTQVCEHQENEERQISKHACYRLTNETLLKIIKNCSACFRDWGYVLKSGKYRTDGNHEIWTDMNNGQHNENFFFLVCSGIRLLHLVHLSSLWARPSQIPTGKFHLRSFCNQCISFHLHQLAWLSDVLKLKPGFRQWFATPLSALGGLRVFCPAP